MKEAPPYIKFDFIESMENYQIFVIYQCIAYKNTICCKFHMISSLSK